MKGIAKFHFFFTNRIVVFVLVILLSFTVCSQSLNKIVKVADDAFESGNYYGAMVSYKKALNMSTVPKIAYSYALACMYNHDYKNAKIWFRYVVSNDKDNYPLSMFYLAEVEKSMGDYQQAMESYRKFLKKGEDKNSYHAKKAEHELIACENAFYLKLNPVGFDIKKISTNVNTVYSEYGISDIGDSVLLFSSFRPDDKNAQNFFSTLFKSQYQEDVFQKWEVLDSTINKSNYHAANPAFSNKTGTLYFCLSEMVDGKALSGIYQSVYSEGQWTNPARLPEPVNIPGTASLQPSVAELPDKELLLFVSNREGGIGKLDIWYCEIKNDGTFGPAFNMAANTNDMDESTRYFVEMKSAVNTIDDDITPFYDPLDSTLYFSSTWHNNMGGFDIFKIKGDFKKWGDPMNMGYPLNTSDNELYYYITSKHSRAYFTSNRPESDFFSNERCCNDIYYYDLPKIINEEEEQEKVLVVLENELKKLIPLTLYFHNDEPNPRTRDTVTQLNYETTFNSYVAMVEEYKTEYSAGVKKNMKEEAVQNIENFFKEEVNKGYSDLTNFSLLLEQLLPEGRIIELTIKGYASPLHATDYNVNLSKRRINSLVNYYKEYKNGLFIQYIDNGQLSFTEEAYGEDEAAVEISDDLKDTRNSVYSPAAAFERKIRLIAVDVTR
ncbi:MAG: hypothetical protein A2W91_01475 [Bacteroidetes bacterium GWF2_38_335]|nr:MAG: hypothetical protein A2W91_01475 [Bacteroidetes bacterium GWF2_38_335]OFY78745.1 MAG: hypothetical protein A2281_19050 [Bacteroidetes bacterium RIFOXYA12_FULL_38_20]HBS85133.1 hypothetical protein [Bacteroidales bacterium]